MNLYFDQNFNFLSCSEFNQCFDFVERKDIKEVYVVYAPVRSDCKKAFLDYIVSRLNIIFNNNVFFEEEDFVPFIEGMLSIFTYGTVSFSCYDISSFVDSFLSNRS